MYEDGTCDYDEVGAIPCGCPKSELIINNSKRRAAILLPCVFLLEMMSAKLRVTDISQHIIATRSLAPS